MSTVNDAHGHDSVRQEPDDTRLSFLLWSCVITALSTVASLYIALWLLNHDEGLLSPRAKAPPAVPGTYEAQGNTGIIERGEFVERSPVQVNGEAQKLKRSEEARLQSGWTDRASGQVHPPISQAIDKVIADYGQRK